MTGDVRALERLDPPDEQEQGAVAGEAERPSGVGPVAGREEGVVHPERDDLDAVRVGPVELDELVDLDGARGQQRRPSNR